MVDWIGVDDDYYVTPCFSSLLLFYCIFYLGAESLVAYWIYGAISYFVLDIKSFC